MSRASIVQRRYLVNRHVSRSGRAAVPGGGPSPLALHRRLPGYHPSPLVHLPAVAERLGVRSVVAKVETERLGLPSFKILGASWAAYRALSERLGEEPVWTDASELPQVVARLRPLKLRTATDGNHGHAVARFARLLGLDASVLVPAGTADARIEAIRSEGADVQVVDGDYEDAVRVAADCDPATTLVVSDTSWPSYDRIPRWVIDGYSTIFREVDEQLRAGGEAPPDIVAIQLGVGALGAAAASWARMYGAPDGPRLLGVEPSTADCVRASILHGGATEVPGPHPSIMAGLNCRLPSPVALPTIRETFTALVAIEDALACDAVRWLAEERLVAGETGAAGLAGLIAVTEHPVDVGPALGLGPDSSLLLVITEGATDPVSYARIVGHAPMADTR